MHAEWLAVEHHRLHIIEEWPAGTRRDAALAAVMSSIASLMRTAPPDAPPLSCNVCDSRRAAATIPFPKVHQLTPVRDRAA
jgi:hypothetical protein